MKHLTRRQFVASLLGAVAAALSGSWLLVYRSRTREAVIVELIRRRLSYLTTDPAGLALFAREYVSRSGSRFRRGIRLARIFGPLFYSPAIRRRFSRRRGFRTEILDFERHVVAQFLLSTDFFRRRHDDSSTVTYVAYSDPYEMGCANPLFQRESSEEESVWGSRRRPISPRAACNAMALSSPLRTRRQTA